MRVRSTPRPPRRPEAARQRLAEPGVVEHSSSGPNGGRPGWVGLVGVTVGLVGGVSLADASMEAVAAMGGLAALGLLVGAIPRWRTRRRGPGQSELQRLRFQNAQLKQRVAELEHLRTEVGHDLRTPLQTTLMALHLLSEECDSPRELEQLEPAIASVNRLQRMIEGLLEASRTTGKPPTRQRVSLDEVLSEALGGLAAKVESSGARVEVCGSLPACRGDADQLVRVVLNLIDNAIKYGGQPAPRIRICGGRVGGRVFLEVEDDGAGVPEAMRRRVFENFAQLESGRDGVGAGLAAVERIVLAHDGHIRVDAGARLGGARFRVVLPAFGEESLRAAG